MAASTSVPLPMATSAPAPIVTVYPTPVYLDVSMENLSYINVAILMASITVAIMFGFNRLVAVPIIAAFCGVLDNSLDWYAYASSYALTNRRVALVVCDICWGAQDAVLTLYSFFLLEKILRGRQRFIFVMVFSALFAAVVGLRFTILVMHQMTLTSEALNDTIDRVTRAYFLDLACLEVLSATFLLRIFYAASGESKFVGSNANLFKRLAHSSELRVATLAGIGITRAACYGADGRIPDGFDNAAYIMQNAFPIALLLDLLTSRVTKLQDSLNGSKGQVDTALCTCACRRMSTLPEKSIGSPKSRVCKGATDSIGSPDFEVYVGKSWSTESSVSAGTKPSAIAESREEA